MTLDLAAPAHASDQDQPVAAFIVDQHLGQGRLQAVGADHAGGVEQGLAPGTVLVRHALKNAAVPIVTIIGIGVALLIGGVVVTETVYAIPGLGSLTVDAVLNRDFPVIQGLVLVFSVLYVLINLLVDLSYLFLDPRIRY